MAITRMTCKELVELVTDYFEGTLPEEDRARFEAHLATCNGCTTYIEQMRQTIRLVGELPEAAITSQAEEELLRVFRDWKQNKPSS
jgi:anti-sigma factor RsiW